MQSRIRFFAGGRNESVGTAVVTGMIDSFKPRTSKKPGLSSLAAFGEGSPEDDGNLKAIVFH
jgi:hypothetical protein